MTTCLADKRYKFIKLHNGRWAGIIDNTYKITHYSRPVIAVSTHGSSLRVSASISSMSSSRIGERDIETAWDGEVCKNAE